MIDVNTENRIIYLSGNVDNESIGSISSALVNLISKDDKSEAEMKDYERKPIHFHISTNGGSVYAALALIDIIEASKTPIYTYCHYALSAGFLLLLAGHKRFSGKRATIMLHTILHSTDGDLQTMTENIEHTQHCYNIICEWITSRCNITKKQLDDIKARKYDWYITPEEALKLGIIDEII